MKKNLIISLVVVLALNACQQPKGAVAEKNATADSSLVTTLSLGPSAFTQCESNTAPEFTSAVVDPLYLRSVSPLPALAGGVAFEGRSYLTVSNQYDGIRIPVYAPVAMKLFAAKNYIPSGAPTGYQPDWALAFQVSCEVSVGFAHIKFVSSKIEAVNAAPLSNSSAPVQTSAVVEFSAGEIIGYYEKGLSSIAFDFIITNSSVNNQFANQTRYEISDNKLLHVVCPWDYFTSELKQTYTDLLAGPGGLPNPALNIGCGKMEQDVVGTVAGAWFLESDSAAGATNAKLAAFLAADGVVYVGNDGFSTLRIYPGNPTKRDPATISGEHCYQDYSTPQTPSGYAYFRVVSAAEIQVVRSLTGVCPAQFPQDGAVTYYR